LLFIEQRGVIDISILQQLKVRNTLYEQHFVATLQ